MGGNATEVITITEINATQGSGTLKVADSAPTGVYLMVYSASDKAGSVGTAERHFVITDKLPPVLTLSGESVDIHEAGTEWIDPGVTAIDAVDGNLTAEVEVSGSVESALKTYYLIYAVTDKSGNQAITTRTVIVVDTMPPVLTLYGSDTVNLNKGEPFIDSGFAAEDAYDGDLAAAVNVSGLEALDVNVSGAYVISYKVWDSSNLFAEANRTIYVEDWNYTIAGKAMDGYLVGASVVFDIDGNGTHDLSKPVTTDENGGFTLAFTKEEFAKVDINQNGIIDFDEGRIRVFGGEDSSTLAPFAGLYVADANSTVVNPLTTLATALVDQGLSREEAKGKVAEALGVPESVDVFSYDLIAAASEGDASSGATLAASARVANAIRQTSAFMQYVSDSAADEKNVSALLVAEVAKNMANGEAVSLGDATQMKDVLEAVVESAGYTSYLTAADLDGASQLLVSADELILESQANNSQPTALASDLAKIQAVVEGGIVWGYENGDTPATLAEIKTKELLAGQKESYSNVNVFPPKAADAEAFLPSDLWSGEAVVHVIGGTDADGDGIQYSIDSGNPDADQDGKAAFSVNANGQLMVEDPDELASIPGGVVSLGVRMADGQGLYGTATVTIRLGNALALETVTVEEAGWRLSAWLGHFYANTASWIYHESLGWLYVSRDGSDGYWLWSANQNAWLWTSSGAHPYFYKYTAGWLYLDVAGSRKMYDFATGQWMDP